MSDKSLMYPVNDLDSSQINGAQIFMRQIYVQLITSEHTFIRSSQEARPVNKSDIYDNISFIVALQMIER